MFAVLLVLLAVERCSSQHLILAGGGLEETNEDVWNKIIELAVSSMGFDSS